MNNDTDWTPVSASRPAPSKVVEVLTPGGDKRKLVYLDGLWWLPDMSMYVYFTPTHWRSLR